MAGVHQMLAGVFDTGPRVSITDQNVADITLTPTDATATYTLQSGGNVVNHNSLLLEQWLLKGAAGDYEARATVLSGDPPNSGTLNTWLALSTTRSWSQTQTTPGVRSGEITVEIRDATTLAILDSATINITAEEGV